MFQVPLKIEKRRQVCPKSPTLLVLCLKEAKIENKQNLLLFSPSLASPLDPVGNGVGLPLASGKPSGVFFHQIEGNQVTFL